MQIGSQPNGQPANQSVLCVCVFFRDKVECDLHFLGLLVMQNQLKPQTTPVIHTLHKASIRTIMITGETIRGSTSPPSSLTGCVERQGCTPASFTETDMLHRNRLQTDLLHRDRLAVQRLVTQRQTCCTETCYTETDWLQGLVTQRQTGYRDLLRRDRLATETCYAETDWLQRLVTQRQTGYRDLLRRDRLATETCYAEADWLQRLVTQRQTGYRDLLHRDRLATETGLFLTS